MRNLDFITCSFVVGIIDYLADKSGMKATFSSMKERTTLFCPEFISQNAGNRILGL